MNCAEEHFLLPAAAYVRGRQLAGEPIGVPEELLETRLELLSIEEQQRIFEFGQAAGLRLHRFKRTMGLRRVQRVLGILHSLSPENLLDIGSGRGAFLWPLIDGFSELPVWVCEMLPHRLRELAAVRAGGVERLSVIGANAEAMPFCDRAFDVVTFLEVLEHIPNACRALSQAARVARRAIVLSVPSKTDDNPEHIHLFDEKSLRQMFAAAGVSRVNFSYVLNHLIAVANVA